MSARKKKKSVGGAKESAEARKPESPIGASLPRFRPLYETAISILILIVGLCVLYPEIVFRNQVFLASDFEAAASFATPIKNAIDNDEAYPLWNPYLYSGMPSYGSLAYNPYVYPVSVLTTFLVKALKFPGMTWMLFHTFMLGLGVWLILRGRGVYFLVAAGCGLLMMWMPNHVAVGAYGHGSQSNAVAYIPFALFFWDRLWRGKGIVLNASILVILLGFQLLRAHLQICYYTFALIGLHLLFFGVLRIKDGIQGVVAGVGSLSVFGRQRPGAQTTKSSLIEVGTAIGVLGIIVVGALLVSAVLFMPVHDYADYSTRGASETGGLDYDYATSWSLHPAEMLTFVVPWSYGFGMASYTGHMPFTDYPNYLGVIVLAFAVLAAVKVRTRFSHFLLFIVVVTTLVAFGRHFSILYSPLFKFMPYFDKFRVPVMVLIVQQFAVVLLFGLGLSHALRWKPSEGRGWATWGTVVAGVLVVLAVALYPYFSGAFAQDIAGRIRGVSSVGAQMELARFVGRMLAGDAIRAALMLLASFTLTLLCLKKIIPAIVLVAVILFLAAADLFSVSHSIHHPEKRFKSLPSAQASDLGIIKNREVRDRFLEPDALVSFLKEQEGLYRVMPVFHPSAPLRGPFTTNRYMNFGISSIGGYHAAKLSVYDQFLRAMAASLQKGSYSLPGMMNAKYIISQNPYPKDMTFLRLVWQGTDFRGVRQFVYENDQALPRAFFVDKYRVLTEREVLGALASERVRLDETVLLEKVPTVTPVSASGGRVEVTHMGFNEIRLEASLDAAAILVLSEVFYPRWRVIVDGVPGEVLKANYVLRAVALDAGDHEIVFEYDTSLLSKSLIISVTTFTVALILLLGSAVYHLRRRTNWNHSS